MYVIRARAYTIRAYVIRGQGVCDQGPGRMYNKGPGRMCQGLYHDIGDKNTSMFD